MNVQTLTQPNMKHALVAFSLLVGLSTTTTAATLDYEVSFSNTSFQVDLSPPVGAPHTFADLVTAHLSGSDRETYTLTGFEGIDTSTHASSNINTGGNYSIMMSTRFSTVMDGNYHFQIGADWGRGGGIALFDADTNSLVQEYVTDEDIWWERNWNHSDVITESYNLGAGNWEVVWVGFEGCCAGETTVRFAFDDGSDPLIDINTLSYSTLDSSNFAPYVVPVPGSIWLFASGIAMASLRIRSQGKTQPH